MSIISLQFIAFAILAVAMYFLVPKKYQWIVLLFVSVEFYLSAGLNSCLYILVTIVTQYFLALALDRKNAVQTKALSETGLSNAQKKEIKQRYSGKKKTLVLLAVVINLGILIVIKYTNPVIETVNNLFGTGARRVDLLVPMGLSYYTFKSIGYVIDVHRGRIPAQRNIFKLALYIGYFPALVQGPIDRYEDLAEQLYAEHNFSYERLCFGARTAHALGLYQKAGHCRTSIGHRQ